MQVSNVMRKKSGEVFYVSPEDSILTTLQMFRRNKVGFAVIGQSLDAILGTISERDICNALSLDPKEGLDTAIRHIMTENVVTCTMHDNLPKVMAIMTGQKTRHVLVYDGDDAKGIISIGDIVKHRLDETLREEEEMRKYIEGTGYSYSG